MKHPRLTLASLATLALCAALSRPDPAASAMDDAGRAFLASLTDEQRERCSFAFSDEERTAWAYLPGDRQGLRIGDLDSDARAQFTLLMQSALSTSGYFKAEGVMTLEGVLRELQPDANRDPGKYAITVFGDPGEGPWAWTLEGHHLSINITAHADDARSTPLMIGVAPAIVRDGPHAGLRVMGAELDAARALIHSLDAKQRAAAQLKETRPTDVVMKPARSEAFPTEGILASALDDSQRAALHDLIAEYTGNLTPQRARAEEARLHAASPDALRFAFTGDATTGILYYRVTSGSTSFEYAAIGTDPNHAHALWRDLDQDFGLDLLREHISKDH